MMAALTREDLKEELGAFESKMGQELREALQVFRAEIRGETQATVNKATDHLAEVIHAVMDIASEQILGLGDRLEIIDIKLARIEDLVDGSKAPQRDFNRSFAALQRRIGRLRHPE